ncbi:nucleolar GTP-binding protein 2 [Plasmodium brasilianum]|uniref:Nucleolar GTP-binding protein 2 n=2 Tax=Plasmodium (Plasmodium) TaxID=418103 RepID=A0A1A8WEH3_PLAMA|nr:nucleolar GTP-binding protein 2, putative [Plasmodium malariae]KAI4835775.1 nucleolar GTP-binding protein 2 [Plasmodium brasilianum]SBS89593.1 nucleolar GTP-binding protein 2, putative (NOG2) [Plasmodium malariae]SCP02713.1 nucleolar GTP-binding protein 2, putative [Plasmodium malariae]
MVRRGNLRLKNLKLARSNVSNVKLDSRSISKENERKKKEEKQKRLKMYRKKADLKKMNKKINEVRRIEPNIKWFNNSRIISQNKLEIFRNKLEECTHDPFSIVIKRSKIPFELLKDEKDCVTKKYKNENLLRIENYNDVFSKKKKRKKPKLNVCTMEEFANNAKRKLCKYETEKDTSLVEKKEKNKNKEREKKYSRDELLKIGQSKRIWTELYKVIDSSDIILEVLDARDPVGTRCKRVEQNIKKHRSNKHIILLINKIDLIPTSVAEKWIKLLSKEYPTIAYHASINKPFGKDDLFNIIRQFSQFYKNQKKKHIHIGLIGYPNVGKSAIINSLKKKVVCVSASVPGQTKYWQFIKLTTKIYLIDSPGIVPYNIEDSDKIIRNTMRLEKITNPHFYIDDILKIVNKKYILNIYKLPQDLTFENSEEFLEILAKKMGKLLKGGQPDITAASKIIISDWIKGKIPYFVNPDTYLREGSGEKQIGVEEGESEEFDKCNESNGEKYVEDK